MNPSNNMISNLELINNQAIHNSKHSKVYRSDTHKQCTKCLKIKLRSDFSKNKKNPSKYDDPHDCRCKQCRASILRIRRSTS